MPKKTSPVRGLGGVQGAASAAGKPRRARGSHPLADALSKSTVSAAELQLGANHSLGGNESLSWDPAGPGPEEAGTVLWAVLGLLLAGLTLGEGMSLTSPVQTSQAPLSCKPTEPSPTTRRAPGPRWLSKLGTWWMLWRRARAVCVHPLESPQGPPPFLATISAGTGTTPVQTQHMSSLRRRMG